MAESNIHVVIMAGGIGTRFWPLSSQACPKQFLALIDSRKSLLQLTYERIRNLTHLKNIWVVSHQDFKKILYRQLPELNRSQFLLEPIRRNTAPCIGWAAAQIQKKNPNAIMVALPADNDVNSIDAFIGDIHVAIHYIQKKSKNLITFGMRPTRPETGYGYIHGFGNSDIVKVGRFVEKPSFAIAQSMIRDRNYFWNSGVFVWKVKTILDEIRQHLPSVHKGLLDITPKNLKSRYQKFPSISIDYGVMEKSKNVHMLKASFEWEDLGSWESVSKKRGSRVKQWIPVDSKNCFIDAPLKRVATIGVSNLVIVETKDSLLICDKSKTQDVRKIAEYLK